MNNMSITQRALGQAWDTLPAALKSHYQFGDNYDEGWLSIDYPGYLQPLFSLLHYTMGVLVNRRGNNVPTRVGKRMRDGMLHFARTLRFVDGKVVLFNSRWEHDEGNRLIEFVTPFLGLRMKVWVDGGKLYYESCSYVFQLGTWQLSIPEWLMLGKAYIIESALDDQHFALDFRVQHPLLGKIFGYTGKFSTVPVASARGKA